MSCAPFSPDDPLAEQLRQSLRRRRPWLVASLIGLVVLLLVPLGLFIWLIGPAAEPPRLGIVAGDALALPAEEVHLRAYLETVADVDFANRAGHEVYFEEVAPFAEGAKPPERTSSNADGAAEVTWRFPAEATQVDFLVRHVDPQPRRNADDRARIFFRPSQTPLLLVDVRTLSPATAQNWATRHVLEIPGRPEAIEALKEAQTRKFQVVYLAGNAKRPRQYRLVRAWLEHRFANQPSLPLGPVLWCQVRDDKVATAWPRVLSGLQQCFSGPIVAVVGTNESATACHNQGLRTFWLDQGPAPAGALKVASWPDLIKTLW